MKILGLSGFVAYVYNSSLLETEIGESKFEDSMGYIVRPCLFEKEKKRKEESDFLGPECYFACFSSDKPDISISFRLVRLKKTKTI